MDILKIDWLSFMNYSEFAIGIIGVWLSIYLYKLSISKKEPKCFYANFPEIENFSGEKSKVKVLFNSKEVERVCTTYLWFWNSGKTPIIKSDIPKQSKLIFSLTNDYSKSIILGVRIAKVTRDSIKPKAKKASSNSVQISFDFLDFNDGFIAEIQHTGNLYTEIIFDGIILGVEKGFKITPHSSLKFGDRPPNRNFTRLGWGSKIFSLATGSFLLFMFFNNSKNYFENINFNEVSFDLTTIVGSILLILFVTSIIVWIVLPWISPFPFPRKLEINFETNKTNEQSILMAVDQFFKRYRK